MRRALIALFVSAALALAAYAQSPPFQADSIRGARQFGELSCAA